MDEVWTMDYFNTRGRKVMRKSRKQVNREERIRLAKHNRKLRAIAKRKSENSRYSSKYTGRNPEIAISPAILTAAISTINKIVF